MSRGLICLAALLVVAAPVPAQTDEPKPTRLTVRPAALPEPALKYELLPELKDKTPGNRALLYQRAHSPEWWSSFSHQKESLKIERWLELPLSQLPRQEMRYLENWSSPLREIDRAAPGSIATGRWSSACGPKALTWCWAMCRASGSTPIRWAPAPAWRWPTATLIERCTRCRPASP